MKLSVVIPSYKGCKLLQDSLPPLYKALKHVKTNEIIVVDNGSKDSTMKYLKDHLPDIKRIELEQNYGFTKAVNEGIRSAKGAYVLILNNDCHVSEQTIHTLLSFLEKNPEYVATQPIILRPDGSVENIGYVVDLKRSRASAVTDKKLIPAFDNQTMWDTGFVYGLSGACLLLRRDIATRIGLFDETFHSYLEDVDFFIRLATQGYQYAPCTDTSVVHQHMSTSKGMKGYKEWHDLTNWVRIIRKNYPLKFILRHVWALGIERMRNMSGWLKRMSRV